MGRSFTLCVVLGIAGCGASPGHHVAAYEFQRACSIDSDCVAVYAGILGCCGGGCPNDAINLSSYAAYETTVQERTPACRPPPPCVAISAELCRAGAICDDGVCTFQHLMPDASIQD